MTAAGGRSHRARAELPELERRWDAARGVFEGDRGPVRLSPGERRVLERLLAARGAPVPRERLGASERSADQTVKRLRAKIESDPSEPRFVLTDHGLGYRLGVPPPRPVAKPRERMDLGDRQLDADLGLVCLLDREIALTTLQRKVLSALICAEGRIVSRQELLRTIWGRSGRSERAVDALICQLRKQIEPVPAAPVHIVTVSGSGYRWQRDPPRTNLSLGPRPAVGREAELGLVVEAALDAGCVLLTGPPGAGKSHLAERAARILADRLPGGAWWVEGGPHRTAAQLAAAVAASLGLSEHLGDIGAAIAARRDRLALVLDGIEQIDGIEALALALSRAGARLVCTSSLARSLPGRSLSLGGLPPAEGRALYLRSVPIGTEVDEDDIDALVAALEGLPMGIVLAAQRVAVLSPRALAQHPEPLSLLSSLPLPDRQGSLHAALDRIWQRASPDERRALLACRAFRAPFGLDAAAAVTGAPLSVLEQLVASSLLARLPTGPEPVFRVPGWVRAWLADRGAPEPETLARWVSWFSERTTVLGATPETRARAELDRTLPDLLEVGRHCIATEPEIAARIALLLDSCSWIPKERVEELAEPLLSSTATFPSCALLLASQIAPASERGDLLLATRRYERAIAAGLDPLSWEAREARSLLAVHRGDFEGTDPGPEPPDSVEHRLAWMFRRGRWQIDAGQHAEGLTLLKQAEMLANRSGHHIIAVKLGLWAALGLEQSTGSGPQVAEALERSMLALEASGCPSAAATAAWHASVARSELGERASARSLAERSLATAHALSLTVCETRAQSALLRNALDGDPSELLFSLGDLSARARATSDGWGEAAAALYAAICHARLGDTSATLALVDGTAPPGPALRAALGAIGALVAPERPMPPPPPGRHWLRSLVLVAAHRRDPREPLDERVARQRERSPVLRAVAAIPAV